MAEAMLAGVPVVTTPFGVGGHADLVQQLAAEATPAEIAAAIRAAAKLRRTVAAAKEFIEAHHNVRDIVARCVIGRFGAH